MDTSIETVSYTHLDVYKRQVHNDSFYEKPDAEDRILITAIKKVFEIKGVPYPTK